MTSNENTIIGAIWLLLLFAACLFTFAMLSVCGPDTGSEPPVGHADRQVGN